MTTRKRKQNKAPSISESDLAKLSSAARKQIEQQLGKIEQAEEKATTPKQKAVVAKRRRSLLARLGTRLRLIASTKKYRVQARNLNKAPVKRIKVRARTETDALVEAKRRLGKGFDEFQVRNPTDQELVILRAAAHTNRNFPTGGPASISEVLKAVSFPRHVTKKVILSLAESGIVALQFHAHPSILTREERKNLLYVPGASKGHVSDYAIGFSLRDLDWYRQIFKNPGRQHLPGVTAKQQRQYEYILKSEMKTGKTKKTSKRIAAATVRSRAKKNTQRIVSRKANRQDIHRIVRDHIRAGRNQKQILDLMKRAGFKKEYLAEARRIYNSEKQLVKRMRTGRNPRKPVIAKYYVGQGWRKAVWDGSKYVGEGPYVDSPEKLKIRGFGKSFTKRITSRKKTGRNPKADKVLSTVKRVAIKAGKMAIGAVKGAIKGGVKAAKGNPATERLMRRVIKAAVDNLSISPNLILQLGLDQGAINSAIRKGYVKRDSGGYIKPTAKGISYLGGAKGNPRRFHPVSLARAKKRVAVIKKSASKKKKVSTQKRKRNSPIAEQQRKQFAGHMDWVGGRLGARVYYPIGTPSNGLSKLGELKKIQTSRVDVKPVPGTSWLCRDTKGNLYIGLLDSKSEMWAGPAQDLGTVQRIEYFETKPHLGDSDWTEYYHRMGEENGVKPHLWSDGKGGLVFRGGAYRIESRGIVN